jgi:hypothetical protein
MEARDLPEMWSRRCRKGECYACTNSQCLHACHREGGVREPRQPSGPPPSLREEATVDA